MESMFGTMMSKGAFGKAYKWKPEIGPVDELQPMETEEASAWLAQWPTIEDLARDRFMGLHPKLKRYVSMKGLDEAKNPTAVLTTLIKHARNLNPNDWLCH